MSGGLSKLVNEVKIPGLIKRCLAENFPFQKKTQEGQNYCYFRESVMKDLKDKGVTCPYADLMLSAMVDGDYHCICGGKKK
jgi:hypothetical protein